MCELITLPNGATAFVCNCKKTDHECNGDKCILLLSNGDRVEDNEINRIKYEKQVVGGSVVCAICGKAAIDSAPYF